MCVTWDLINRVIYLCWVRNWWHGLTFTFWAALIWLLMPLFLQFTSLKILQLTLTLSFHSIDISLPFCSEQNNMSPWALAWLCSLFSFSLVVPLQISICALYQVKIQNINCHWYSSHCPIQKTAMVLHCM